MRRKPKARLEEILEEAQRQPILIRRQAQDTAVVVSMTEHERLRALDVQAFLALGTGHDRRRRLHEGLRIGELLALRWHNLDLTIGTLSVRESVFEGKAQQPKTQKARRTIPLGPHAIAQLKEHRDRATRKSADDLVFPNRQGEPMRESKLPGRVLQPAAERAELGRVTWHQFRHIHSSLLNDLRVPVKIAQEQLGHASISTTLNIYTHVVDASHRAAIEQPSGKPAEFSRACHLPPSTIVGSCWQNRLVLARHGDNPGDSGPRRFGYPA